MNDFLEAIRKHPYKVFAICLFIYMIVEKISEKK